MHYYHNELNKLFFFFKTLLLKQLLSGFLVSRAVDASPGAS